MNVASAFLTWVILAWAAFLLAFTVGSPGAEKKNSSNMVMREGNRQEDIFQGELTRRSSSVQPGGYLRGWKGVMSFFLIAIPIFGYFEVQYCGFVLLHQWEICLYAIILVPYFILAYISRRWIPLWRVYIWLWIMWGIIWDTAVPGFVYVPNLFSWHQWMFSAVAARFVVDGNLQIS